MNPVHLVGPSVALREFTEEDAAQATQVVGDDRVTSWLSFNSKTSDETAAMIRGIVERAKTTPRSEYYLAVTLPCGDQVIGFARLGLSGVQAGKLGYAIHADHWGQGYATAAVELLTDFAFKQLKLHRVSAAIGPDNAASIAVVQRQGFTYEGLLRDHVWTNGSWRDSQLYSVLVHEWSTRRISSVGAQDETPGRLR